MIRLSQNDYSIRLLDMKQEGDKYILTYEHAGQSSELSVPARVLEGRTKIEIERFVSEHLELSGSPALVGGTKREVYYQPVLSETEWGMVEMHDYEVYHSLEEAQAAFPGAAIREYQGDEIEEHIYLDDPPVERNDVETMELVGRPSGETMEVPRVFSYRLLGVGPVTWDEESSEYWYDDNRKSEILGVIGEGT